MAERYRGSCRHEGGRSGSKFLRSPRQKAERVFESAPITKRYDSFTLGTADGITVRIQGVINKACSHQNGIPLEVCNSFLIGFPYNWDNYAGPCFEGKFNSASVPESAASANELSEGCLFPIHLDDFSLSRIHDGSVDGSVTRKFRDFLERFCYTTKPVASDVHNCTLPLVESCLPHEPPSKYERAIAHTQVTDGLEHEARFEKFSCLSSRDHQNILVEGLDPTPPWKKIAEKEKYEKERIRQKHGNGLNHVGEGYVVGPPEAAGCYRDGLQGDEVDGGNLITAHIENNVSLGSSLYATSQVNTLPIKVADVQKISLESIPVDNCISLATSIRVSMGTVDLIPNCTGEANSESSSSLADGVITENFSVLTSEVQQNVSLDSSMHLTSQVDRQVPSSENKPEPDNCIHLASSVTVSLDTVNDIPNCIGEANKDINTSLADSGIESIVADVLPEEFNLPNSKHAKELRIVRRSDDSERIGEHDIALSKGFLAREISDTEDGYSSRKDMNPLLHISLKPVMAPQLTAESSENNEKYIFQVVKDSIPHVDSVDKRSNITSKMWLKDHLSCGMQLGATGTEYVEETLTDVKPCLPQGTPSKYEREKNNQKHENGTNYVAEGHTAVPSKSVGNELHANGVLRNNSIDITSNAGLEVSCNSILRLTSRIDTVPLKGSCTQKGTLLENLTETEKAIHIPRSDPVSLDMKDSIYRMPNCIEDTNSESFECSADLGIESGLVRNVSDMKDTNSLIPLEISRKPVIAISPKASDSKEKVCRRSSRFASILHPEILATDGNSEFRVPKDCTASISSVHMSVTSDVGLDESLTKPLGRRDRSMKLKSFKKDQQCAECMNSRSCMHRTPSKPHESAGNEKCQTKLDMPGKGICGATDDMFCTENNTMPIKRRSTTQSVVRKLYYTTRSGRLVGSSTNECQSLDERVNERMENVEDIPATDATSISRTTKSKNQGGVDQTISSLKAETNGDRVVRVDHSFVKTVNDGKYKRRNLSACDLATAQAVYFTHESSATKLQIDPAPTSDTEGGGLTDEQISVNTGHESEFLKSTNANTTQSDTIMGIHSSKEKILDLSINKIQNNQSKRGRKKKQSPLSVNRAYKKGRSLHSSGRAIWRPSYDNKYPLTRDTAKKLCIASPESLNLKRSRSGRLLVPPIARWCQKIIYAANGEIMGITRKGLENFPCIESESEPPRKRKGLV